MENKMAELAKLFDLDLNEEFYIEGYAPSYRFTENGLEYLSSEQKKWYISSGKVLEDLLLGVEKVIRKPFRPKDNENYYYVVWFFDSKWELTVKNTYFTCGSAYDNLNRDGGNCFRTYEDAENAKYEVFKRLTGMDWKEIFGGKYD